MNRILSIDILQQMDFHLDVLFQWLFIKFLKNATCTFYIYMFCINIWNEVKNFTYPTICLSPLYHLIFFVKLKIYINVTKLKLILVKLIKKHLILFKLNEINQISSYFSDLTKKKEMVFLFRDFVEAVFFLISPFRKVNYLLSMSRSLI